MNLANTTMNELLLIRLKYLLVLLIINLSLDVNALDVNPKQVINSSWTSQDSVVIKKHNSKRTYLVLKDQKIKIWVDKLSTKGDFLEFKNDTLYMNKKGAIIKYNVNDIKKIKVYGNLARNIIGGGFKIWGGAIFVAAFVPLLDVGPAGLIISIPSWIVGFGIYKLGDFLDGNRTFNLEKKWYIDLAK